VTRYLLTSDAANDIDLIKTYLISQGGHRLAQHVLVRVRRAMVFLAGRPDAGHARRDLSSDPVKFWQVFSYLIIYDPAPRPIHILRVHQPRHRGCITVECAGAIGSYLPMRVLHASRAICAILQSTTQGG
jgi:plasmid stabilization system protein ParE